MPVSLPRYVLAHLAELTAEGLVRASDVRRFFPLLTVEEVAEARRRVALACGPEFQKYTPAVRDIESDHAHAMARKVRIRGELAYLPNRAAYNLKRSAVPLPILNPRFTLDDVSSRLASYVIRREYRHLFPRSTTHARRRSEDVQGYREPRGRREIARRCG
jgi:hypothetical protein